VGALVGLGVGVGALLIWSAFAWPRVAAPAERRPGRWERALAEAGMTSMTPRVLALLCAMSGLVAFVLLLAATRTAPLALVMGALASYLPVAMVSGRIRRRRRDFAEVWPEAVDNLASAVRAGLSLAEALTQLGHRGPEPLREPFQAFGIDYQVTGRFGESLDRLKVRLSDPVGDRVVEGLRIAREVGGGELGSLLRHLSGFLREDARTRSELESRQAWTVNGARLAVAAPWLVLLMLCFQREVISRYASPAGVAVLGIGAALCLVAYRLMVRIGRLPTERRVLS
jgi:tight adherence protein B